MHSRPPYRLTPKTLDLLLRLHEQIGAVQALETSALNPGVRRHNRIRTVHATLHLEGNSLDLQQAEALTREEVVFASNRDVLEWNNRFQQQVRPPLLPRSNLHKNKLVRPLLLVNVQI